MFCWPMGGHELVCKGTRSSNISFSNKLHLFHIWRRSSSIPWNIEYRFSEAGTLTLVLYFASWIYLPILREYPAIIKRSWVYHKVQPISRIVQKSIRLDFTDMTAKEIMSCLRIVLLFEPYSLCWCQEFLTPTAVPEVFLRAAISHSRLMRW